VSSHSQYDGWMCLSDTTSPPSHWQDLIFSSKMHSLPNRLKERDSLLSLTEDKKCLLVRDFICPEKFHKSNLLNQMYLFDYSI